MAVTLRGSTLGRMIEPPEYSLGSQGEKMTPCRPTRSAVPSGLVTITAGPGVSTTMSHRPLPGATLSGASAVWAPS